MSKHEIETFRDQVNTIPEYLDIVTDDLYNIVANDEVNPLVADLLTMAQETLVEATDYMKGKRHA